MNTDKLNSNSYPRSSAFIGGPYLFRLLTQLAVSPLLQKEARAAVVQSFATFASELGA
jgi:hypothetical protein